MAAVLEATRDPAYGARVCAVISDRTDAPGLDIAREAGIPTAVVDMRDFPDREAWDRGVAAALASFTPDLVLLAGFMRILGEPVLAAYGGRIVNTHPALLPSYPGAHGVRDALAGGAKVTGCSVILVDAGVDTGPILAQAPVAVRPDDTEESLHERIKQVERPLVVDTVGTMLREGWTVEGHVAWLGQEKGNS